MCEKIENGIPCPKCGGTEWYDLWAIFNDMSQLYRWICDSCGEYFTNGMRPMRCQIENGN